MSNGRANWRGKTCTKGKTSSLTMSPGSGKFACMTPIQKDHSVSVVVSLVGSSHARNFRYKNHLETILERHNTIRGLDYREDGAIFSFAVAFLSFSLRRGKAGI